MKRLRNQPRSPPATIPRTAAKTRERRQEADDARQPVEVEEVGGEHAERDQLGVGEVDQAGRAEDQREPDRRHGQVQTLLEPLRPELGEAPEAEVVTSRLRHLPLDQGEQHATGPGVADLGLQRVVLGVAQVDPLREGLLVERDDVVTVARHGDGEVAIGIRGRRLAEAVALDEDHDPCDGQILLELAVLVVEVAEDRRVVGLLRAGSGRSDEPEQQTDDDREEPEGGRTSRRTPPPNAQRTVHPGHDGGLL